ncbi:hypothetical protein DNTS_008200 [Danionella cerebrum]|uniref:RRM domain-containing protein n=1 Tax=Danionella cerebrum TaxID=2873325 RepID=A0A553R5K0_9TELE|nr:hypothetical protein DNTS_008200 [Danionella translucida]
MSYNNSFRTQDRDDRERIYPHVSNTYSSGIRNMSADRISSSDLSVFQPNKAMSFLHSCGLDADDFQTLAKLPEHLITADNLPNLLTELKKNKMSGTSSSRSGGLHSSSSTHSWEEMNRSQGESVDYPLDMPVRQTYTHERQPIKTWDDHLEDDQQTSSLAKPNYVVEYNHLKEKSPYYGVAETSRLKSSSSSSSSPSSSAPQSYSSFGRDVSHSSLSSHREVSLSTKFSNRDIVQSSHLSSRDPAPFSHLTSRYQSSQRLSRDTTQSSYASGRDVGRPSSLSNRDVGVSSIFSSDSRSSSTLSSRDIGQSSLVSSKQALPSILSLRVPAPTLNPTSRNIGLSSSRKRPREPRVPTKKEASDFHGRTPPVFPYACVLCEIAVLSNKDWTAHITGPQHANSQFKLVEKYPDWDQKIQSARRTDSDTEKPYNETRLERGSAEKTSGNNKRSSGSRRSARTSIKSEPSKITNQKKSAPSSKCKVVNIKFETDEVDEAYLKNVLGKFGAIVRVIVFPRLALVEMGEPSQAEDVVKYFLQNPLKFKGHRLEFTLSSAFSFLQNSRVVSFTSLPSGDGVNSELKAIAKRFGTIKNAVFLPKRVYIEMAELEEANKMVEHYLTNSLKIKGAIINVNFSSEYQTLKDLIPDLDKSPVHSSSKRRSRESPSPKRVKRRSPSPKRKDTDDKSRSHRSKDSKTRDEKQDSRQEFKMESRSHSKKKSSKDEVNTKEKSSTEIKDKGPGEDGDSDLEGVAVIADFSEEWNTEDELTIDELEDNETVEQPNDSNNQVSDMDSLNVQTEMPTTVINSETSVGDGLKKELQQGEQNEKLSNGEQNKEIKNEEQNEDVKEELLQGEQKDTKEPMKEETLGRVLEVSGFPVAKKYCEKNLLDIGSKYGVVADYCLVRKNRKVEKALIEMTTAADAAKLEADSKMQKIKVAGKVLKITVSQKYIRINEGNGSDSGKAEVHEIVEKSVEPSRSIPGEESTGIITESQMSEEDVDAQMETNVDSILQPSTGEQKLVEMDFASDADNVASAPGPTDEIRTSTQTPVNKTETSDADKEKLVSPSPEPEVKEELLDNVPETQPPILNPAGTEFVRPVVGYMCSLCNCIYASEEEAKNEHCRSPLHHQKLKEHTEGKAST